MESEQNTENNPILFELVGMLTSTAFQKCRIYVERLHRSFPHMFLKPIIRPMLNVDWTQYLTQIKRTIGRKSWYSEKPVAVFVNAKYIGDDDDFIYFIKKDFFFSINKSLATLVQRKLKEYIVALTETGRRLVYLAIEIDGKYIGTLLFLLYTDLVPITCNNFLKRCSRSRCTYQNKPIHRIAKGGWIQGGDWNMTHIPMPCENYIVPHDRRGVLSMSNSEKHTNNSTQFIVSLVAAPWMNYKYVAFGQLIQGEEVLAAIENVPTVYEYPTKNIRIINTGEYSLDRSHTVPDKHVDEVQRFLSTMPDRQQFAKVNLQQDIVHPGDVPSDVLLRERLEAGLYSHELDFQSHLNSQIQLPKHLLLDIEWENGDSDKSVASGLSSESSFEVVSDEKLQNRHEEVDFSYKQLVQDDATYANDWAAG